MPSHIPLFTMQNYVSLMDKEYSQQGTIQTIPFWEFINSLSESVVKTYRDLDARKLGEFLSVLPVGKSIAIGGISIPESEAIAALKLACPTLRCCNYFFWNIGQGTHAGIDIILPQGTPILSISDGQVIKIKTWDGITKNEGNCVVVQSTDGYIVGYEHLDRIDVGVGQIVNQGDQLGTCGSTGNSTQYHLHLQVDKSFAPFHPYRSTDLSQIKRYTIDPLAYLKAHSPIDPFLDTPTDPGYSQSITTLRKAILIKGYDRKIYPDKTLKRYEMALMIDRVLRMYSLYDSFPVIVPAFSAYDDTALGDQEVDQALARLQKYGIMKGNGQSFFPQKELLGEEFLAILGRTFFSLQDSSTGQRYERHIQYFNQEGFIASPRAWKGKAIPRKEVFVLLATVLVRKGIIS